MRIFFQNLAAFLFNSKIRFTLVLAEVGLTGGGSALFWKKLIICSVESIILGHRVDYNIGNVHIGVYANGAIFRPGAASSLISKHLPQWIAEGSIFSVFSDAYIFFLNLTENCVFIVRFIMFFILIQTVSWLHFFLVDFFSF